MILIRSEMDMYVSIFQYCVWCADEEEDKSDDKGQEQVFDTLDT